MGLKKVITRQIYEVGRKVAAIYFISNFIIKVFEC